MLTLYPNINSSSAFIIPTIDITEGTVLAVGITIMQLESSPSKAENFRP